MTALARHLQARNHDVVFLYSSGAAGLPFVPGPEKDHVNESILEVSRMQGDDVLELSVRLALAQTETVNQRMTYRRSISYSVQRQNGSNFFEISDNSAAVIPECLRKAPAIRISTTRTVQPRRRLRRSPKLLRPASRLRPSKIIAPLLKFDPDGDLSPM